MLSDNGQAVHICIVVDTDKAGIHYSKYGRAWPLSDNLCQQNQNCRLLFSKWKREDNNKKREKQVNILNQILWNCRPLVIENEDIHETKVFTWWNYNVNPCLLLSIHPVCAVFKKVSYISDRFILFHPSNQARNQLLVIWVSSFSSEHGVENIFLTES